MRHPWSRLVPERNSGIWWRTRVVLWIVTVFMLAVLAIRSPILPDLARTATLRVSKVRSWAGKAMDARTTPGPAPDFTLTLFSGDTFRLTDYRGQVVVVNFWASWCPPCRREASRLETVYQRYRTSGVVFIGVDVEDTDGDARSFIQQYGISYPNGPDRSSRIDTDYGVAGLPTTVVVNPDGQIHRAWQGEIQEAQLTGFIEETLR